MNFLCWVGAPRFVDRARQETTKSKNGRREVPPLEAKTITTILEHLAAAVVPESAEGLDGTTYTLQIKRGPLILVRDLTY